MGQAIDELADHSEIVIDWPKGTAHPKYPDFIYQVDAIMCVVDLMKKDSEIKILIGCTEEEKAKELFRTKY